MAELTAQEIDHIADRLINAITASDTDAVRAVYAPDAAIWHNFDQKDQTVDENLATLVDMHRRATDLQYTQIRRFAAPDGFVQQHVLVGDATYGRLELPAMIRFWVADGRITRLEEYVDTRQAMVMYRG
jgi:ketosteroid isomerase-like protein